MRYMIVDNAIYVDGRRVAEPESVEETYQACRNHRGLAWIGSTSPQKRSFPLWPRSSDCTP